MYIPFVKKQKYCPTVGIQIKYYCGHSKNLAFKGCTLNVNESERKELFPIIRYYPNIIYSERGGKLRNASVALINYQSDIQIWDVRSAN
jgi:hypothetical protein